MAHVHLPTVDARGFGATRRRDAWWVGPLLTALVLGGFIVYATWAALQNGYYEAGPYLSPLYSPLFKPSWWPLSPAFLILWAPGGFRLTCYYYRKAYYRAFLADPPGCAVGEPRKSYRGETSFPFVLQNLHRFFFYLAVVFIGILAYDAVKAFFFADGFGIGVGTLVLCGNTVFLGLYTFSCHSCRHAVGGGVNCWQKVPAGALRYRLWQITSRLNRHHMLFAWMSLFSVGFADFYVRMVAMGVFTDLRVL
jgi:hypothetical protein